MIMPLELAAYHGVGPVRFGMSPVEARRHFGEHTVWEPWMGGNLNDSLFYPGIVLFFDKYDGHGPLNDAKLVRIEVNQTFSGVWSRITLGAITPQVALETLGDAGYLKEYGSGIHVHGPGVLLRFDSSGHIQTLSLDSRNGA